MSGVFRNIDHPPPHPLASVYPPAFGAGGGHTRWVERGVEEDARHCSVLYICKYFVGNPHAGGKDGESPQSPATGSSSGSQTTTPSDGGARESGDGVLDRKAREL
jgi:hypothetical protein